MKGRPITKKDLSEITNSDINSINDAIKDLKNKYSNPNSAIELNAVNNSFSLELKSSLNEFVDDLLPSDLKTSEFVISERSFFVIGLPFKYRTASTLVTRSISDIGVLFRSDWLILITEIFPNLP